MVRIHVARSQVSFAGVAVMIVCIVACTAVSLPAAFKQEYAHERDRIKKCARVRCNPAESARLCWRYIRKALLINVFDESMRGLLSSGRLAAVYYSVRGQEVLAAAMGVNLRPTDYIVTTYRGIHDQLAKGMPLRELCAEYYGKATGTCKGKGGPMHITYPKAGIMVTTGVVGSGLPIANGLALASQLKKDGRVTVCTFGDGASNIGAFHESLNMASLWKLPVVFLCQNNGYGECTKYEKATAVANIAERAASYNMRGVTVDGNDAEACGEHRVKLSSVPVPVKVRHCSKRRPSASWGTTSAIRARTSRRTNTRRRSRAIRCRDVGLQSSPRALRPRSSSKRCEERSMRKSTMR